MTASHLFYDGKIVDISVNYEIHCKEGTPIEYDINEAGFKAIL